MPATPLTNTLVTLYVDTSASLTPTTIKDHVWFADTDGDIVNNHGGTIENYLTTVQKNGNITWVGAVQNILANPSDYVLIEDIIVSTGNQSKIDINLEPSNPANGNTTHVNGRVRGGTTTTPFKYTIKFKVGKINENGQKNTADFEIDPRIQIN